MPVKLLTSHALKFPDARNTFLKANARSENYLTTYQTNIAYGIITIGILLRGIHYFYNRSLWEDEIYLSSGIIKLNFFQLFNHPLLYQQKAPLGYLLITKLILLIFGNREMPLRLFPFICGILSLFVFKRVAQCFLKPTSLLIALAILAFSPQLIYHSVEAKQYSTELFAAILMLYTYVISHKRYDFKSTLLWGLYGATIVWFSFSIIFVMAAIGITLTAGSLITKQKQAFIMQSLTFSIWIISFVLNYLLFSGKDAHTGWLIDFYIKRDAFMPVSLNAFAWIWHQLFSFLNYPMGFSWFSGGDYDSRMHQMLARMSWLPMLVSILGLLSLFKTDRKLLSIILLSYFIVFVASAFKLYPFYERLTVFLAPVFILLVSAGCRLLFTILKERWLKFLLVTALLFGSLYNSYIVLWQPNLFGDYKKSYHREALTYIDKNLKPGDIVYIYWNNLPAYNYYKIAYPLDYSGIQGKDYRYSTSNFSQYFGKLNADFKGFEMHKRVWIIYDNRFDIAIGDYIGLPKWYYGKTNAPVLLREWLLKKGRIIQQFNPTGNNSDCVLLMEFDSNNFIEKGSGIGTE